MTPLTIAFTPNYFVPAAVMLRSLLDSSTGDFEVICLVTEEIPKRMQEKLLRLGEGRLYRETELGNNWLGVVFEAPIEQQAERFRALGCDPMRYFNSGFLLMNLARMREEKVSDQLLEACRVPYLEFPDQDALNQVCQGHVLPLSPLYNGIRTFFIPKYRPDFERQYGKDLWTEIQEHATFHYTGGKPWQLFTV